MHFRELVAAKPGKLPGNTMKTMPEAAPVFTGRASSHRSV
jgi:hypothetical protein